LQEEPSEYVGQSYSKRDIFAVDAYKGNNAGFTQNVCNSQVVSVKCLKAAVRTEPFIQVLKFLGK